MSRLGARALADVQRDLDDLNLKAEQDDADIKRAEEALRLAKEVRERTGRSIIEKNPSKRGGKWRPAQEPNTPAKKRRIGPDGSGRHWKRSWKL